MLIWKKLADCVLLSARNWMNCFRIGVGIFNVGLSKCCTCDYL